MIHLLTILYEIVKNLCHCSNATPFLEHFLFSDVLDVDKDDPGSCHN